MTIYHENKGRYGYRRITIELGKRNIPLNHKTVQRLMKELGLVCHVRMKKYRSYKGETGKIAPNLLNRDFYAEKPNRKWVTDVTEFRLLGEKLYLSPILDLHSSDLVSYTISDRPVLSMATAMLDKERRELHPCYHGSRCVCGLYRQIVDDREGGGIRERELVGSQRYRSRWKDDDGNRQSFG